MQMSLAPLSTKLKHPEEQTRNFELEDRVRHLEASLMDAQHKVEDTTAQLRAVAADCKKLSAENENLKQQVEDLECGGGKTGEPSAMESDLQR